MGEHIAFDARLKYPYVAFICIKYPYVALICIKYLYVALICIKYPYIALICINHYTGNDLKCWYCGVSPVVDENGNHEMFTYSKNKL